MPRLPEVHFRLKSKDENGDSLIYLQFLYNKQRLFFSFGEKINAKDWNSNKQRAKNKTALTADGEHSLNDLLDNLQEVCETAYKREKSKGIPTPDILRIRLQEFLNHNLVKAANDNSFFALFERFVAGEIKYKGKDKSPHTLSNYKTVKAHLKAYEVAYKTHLTFELITLNFFYQYTSFLKSIGLATNTMAKDITVLKKVMRTANKLKLTNNKEYTDEEFTVAEEETDAVYLTEKELDILYKHDLSQDKRLEEVRDLFIFSAWVGLRYGDYSTVKPEHIVEIEMENGDKERFIKRITGKTKELVYIPCNDVVLQIFDKYKSNRNNLPKTISSQKFNEYLHEVCEKAKFTEKGRLSTYAELELWKCVTSHTARRCFATNYYLQGFPIKYLMQITGHRTEKSFYKYIKISKLEAAKKLSEHMKKRWSEKMLKVA